MRYGGNTPCLELTTPAGTRFILDCGTGLRALSNRASALAKGGEINAHIFVTHYHWDRGSGACHFSVPLYSPHKQVSLLQFSLGLPWPRQPLAGLGRPDGASVFPGGSERYVSGSARFCGIGME